MPIALRKQSDPRTTQQIRDYLRVLFEQDLTFAQAVEKASILNHPHYGVFAALWAKWSDKAEAERRRHKAA